MGRFESPWQIGCLFAGAAVASVLVIVVINLEAKKRGFEDDLQSSSIVIIPEHSDHKHHQDTSDPPITIEVRHPLTFWEKMKKIVHILFDKDTDEDDIKTKEDEREKSEENNVRRKKRSIDDHQNRYYAFLQAITTDSVSHNDNRHSALGENLLTESLSGHKIRQIDQKIKHLHESDQVVQAILKEFCLTQSTTTLEQTTTESVEVEVEHQNDTMTRYYNTLDEENSDVPDDPPEDDMKSLDQSVMHPFPPIVTHAEEGFKPPGMVKDHLHCYSQATLLAAIAVTCVINLSFCALISCCRSMYSKVPDAYDEYMEERFPRIIGHYEQLYSPLDNTEEAERNVMEHLVKHEVKESLSPYNVNV